MKKDWGNGPISSQEMNHVAKIYKKVNKVLGNNEKNAFVFRSLFCKIVFAQRKQIKADSDKPTNQMEYSILRIKSSN